MPYIKPEDRRIIDNEIDALVNRAFLIPDFEANRGGVFNYIITRLALNFAGKKSYKNLSLMRSAMVDAEAEWYRRQMSPYEDEKAEENGDVES